MSLDLDIENIFDEVIDIQSKAIDERESKNVDYIIEKVSPDLICSNKFNDIYNKFNTSEADQELKDSILEHGLLENLVVTPNDCSYDDSYNTNKYKYRLISGDRRLHAIKEIIKEADSATAKRFIMLPVKIEKYSSPEEELLMLNTYNLHSRTLSAEDKLLVLGDVRKKLEGLLGDRELTEKQKVIKDELKKYKSLFEGMARATKSRYISISTHGNPEVINLISEGFTIHQLVKITSFPGDNYKPLHSMLSEEKREKLLPLLDQTGDLQAEVLNAVNYLKSQGQWQNDANIKIWRNYIIECFVNPIHGCLQTAKSNCAAYEMATIIKDKENAVSKIKKQVNTIQKTTEIFIEGYISGDFNIFRKKAALHKNNVERITSDFRKINDKEEMLKVLKALVAQAKEAEAINSDDSLTIMSLL